MSSQNPTPHPSWHASHLTDNSPGHPHTQEDETKPLPLDIVSQGKKDGVRRARCKFHHEYHKRRRDLQDHGVPEEKANEFWPILPPCDCCEHKDHAETHDCRHCSSASDHCRHCPDYTQTEGPADNTTSPEPLEGPRQPASWIDNFALYLFLFVMINAITLTIFGAVAAAAAVYLPSSITRQLGTLALLGLCGCALQEIVYLSDRFLWGRVPVLMVAMSKYVLLLSFLTSLFYEEQMPDLVSAGGAVLTSATAFSWMIMNLQERYVSEPHEARVRVL
ncbi:hypothetical protein F5Y15DRAFT_412453 [Xylariaceae sp. FL0016]|nr:hypothetical protein F5Y15DRAFT_412453 [Xylariaceae sp. FL0016]